MSVSVGSGEADRPVLVTVLVDPPLPVPTAGGVSEVRTGSGLWVSTGAGDEVVESGSRTDPRAELIPPSRFDDVDDGLVVAGGVALVRVDLKVGAARGVVVVVGDGSSSVSVDEDGVGDGGSSWSVEDVRLVDVDVGRLGGVDDDGGVSSGNGNRLVGVTPVDVALADEVRAGASSSLDEVAALGVELVVRSGVELVVRSRVELVVRSGVELVARSGVELGVVREVDLSEVDAGSVRDEMRALTWSSLDVVLCAVEVDDGFDDEDDDEDEDDGEDDDPSMSTSTAAKRRAQRAGRDETDGVPRPTSFAPSPPAQLLQVPLPPGLFDVRGQPEPDVLLRPPKLLRRDQTCPPLSRVRVEADEDEEAGADRGQSGLHLDFGTRMYGYRGRGPARSLKGLSRRAGVSAVAGTVGGWGERRESAAESPGSSREGRVRAEGAWSPRVSWGGGRNRSGDGRRMSCRWQG